MMYPTTDKKRFWSVFLYGDAVMLCSKHDSIPAALRAAKRCRKQGGAPHRVLMVKDVTPPSLFFRGVI